MPVACAHGVGSRFRPNQIASVAGDDRRADDLVAAFSHVNLDKPFVFAVEDRAVVVPQMLNIRVDCHSAIGRLMLVQTDVGDFR